jgi:hypothetical protein
MTDNRERVLKMLADEKITVEEATRLLELTDRKVGGDTEPAPSAKKKPKYLRVLIDPGATGKSDGDVERVNIRVPMALIRAGVKLTSLIPHDAADKVDTTLKDKGIDFSLRNIKDEDLEQLVEALSDLEVDIEGGPQKVRIYAE